MSKIKVILSDLDGVIRNYPIHQSFDAEVELGLEAGGLLPVAFQRKYLEPVITGLITDEEWRQKIIEELSQRFEKEKVSSAIRKWSAYPGILDDDVYRLYRIKKADCKIALLSNATSKLNSDLKILGIFDLFDVIYNTSEIGFAKPDPRAFHHVLNTISHSPDEILFVDDREENIVVAQALGFEVHHFKNFDELRRVFKT